MYEFKASYMTLKCRFAAPTFGDEEWDIPAISHLWHYERHRSHSRVQTARTVATAVDCSLSVVLVLFCTNQVLTSASMSSSHNRSSILSIGSVCTMHCSSNSVEASPFMDETVAMLFHMSSVSSESNNC